MTWHITLAIAQTLDCEAIINTKIVRWSNKATSKVNNPRYDLNCVPYSAEHNTYSIEAIDIDEAKDFIKDILHKCKKTTDQLVINIHGCAMKDGDWIDICTWLFDKEKHSIEYLHKKYCNILDEKEKLYIENLLKEKGFDRINTKETCKRTLVRCFQKSFEEKFVWYKARINKYYSASNPFHLNQFLHLEHPMKEIIQIELAKKLRTKESFEETCKRLGSVFTELLSHK